MTTIPTTYSEQIVLPPSAMPRPDATAALTATDILAMLRRRVVLIFVTFFILVGLVGGGFYVWWQYFPGYRAECLIECVSNIPAAELSLERERLRQEEHERFVATQALLLKSPSILSEALQVTAVRDTTWFKDCNDDPLLELTDDLSAAPVRGTNFLRVAMEARMRTNAAIIVNEVVRQWLETVKKRSSDEFAAQLQAAQAELQAMDANIDAKRRQLRATGAQLPPGVRLSPDNSLAMQEARQLSANASVLELETNVLTQFSEYYNSPEGIAVTAEDRSLVEQNVEITELRRMLFALEQRQAADLSRYGSKHAVIRELDSQINSAREKLGELEAQKLAEVQAANREAALTALRNSQEALFLTQERMLRAESSLQDQAERFFEYDTLVKEIDRDVEDRRKHSEYVKEIERVVRQRSAVDISVAQPAVDPLERSSPSLLLIPLGIFAALACAAGLGLGLELMDKSVRTSQDIIRHLDIPMLGAVPHTDDEEVDIPRVETAVRDAPRSMVAEAFRRIRTNLQYSAPAIRQRSIVLTSPHPHDGKTTVACNLAIAAAQGGRRVLLVDANFRRPGLHAIFGVADAKGLSNVLVHEGTLANVVSRTDHPSLDVMTSGPIPPNPADLLGGESFRQFVEEAVAQYDQIVIDTAPVLIATDALVIATVVDGVVLVVRAKESSRGAARRACGLLANVGAHLFGAVLNAAQVTRGGYYREQLRSYYDYHEEAQPPALPKSPA